MNLNKMTTWPPFLRGGRKVISLASLCVKIGSKRVEDLCRLYLPWSLMCWNKVRAFMVSNNLQSNDVVDVATSKFPQLINGTLKLPTIELLHLLHQDLSLLWKNHLFIVTKTFNRRWNLKLCCLSLSTIARTGLQNVVALDWISHNPCVNLSLKHILILYRQSAGKKISDWLFA